ncbi:AIR synthase related protein [Methanothermococcus okinawensis]|uniref:AIR synthase related protein n=1 Tax=Methanothermococcus okinawensis (strain DSM 14208 / JCM 11175 / IH1) TaxID=647113 RepID=F8AJR4_METOI|nr:AIR synthase related protein [Methanothermococcus okinawensis]AEH07262.1 AIR synthase related protein [Methanothermococcus okinawensis IH1]
MEHIEYEIKHAIGHMMETNYPRKKLWDMDSKIPDLIRGIRAGDDAVVIGKRVINMEGPYPLKLGSKTALIHTSCDIVAMGAKPLYAMDAIQARDEEEIKMAVDGLKKQSIGLNIPIVGGNTQTEKELKSCVSIVIFGELLHDKVIIDGGAQAGDVVVMLGHPVEGDVGDRVQRAKNKYDTFLKILESGVDVHACKDASRGGWLCNILEMLAKAKKGININAIPYPRATRYLGTYLVCMDENDLNDAMDIAINNRCPIIPFGKITEEKTLKIGNKEYIDEEKMNNIVKEFPYKY